MERKVTEKPRVQRISTLVSQLMSRRGYAQRIAGEDFHSTIGVAVGGQLGDSITVGKLKSGVLQIFAADSVTLQELNFQKRSILKQIQKDLPQSKVSDVRFRILTK
jgi:predicted nucleic acid-binding Zn ribbon protein